jgi:hypothetical protein
MWSAILTTVITKVLEMLGAFGLKLFKRYLRSVEIDGEVKNEAQAVNKAVKDAKAHVEKCEGCGVQRISEEDEQKLRETTRKLTDGFFT